MHWDADHIRQLVIEEIAGLISDTDAEMLRQIISEDPEALEFYNELHKELSDPGISYGLGAFLHDVQAEKLLNDVKIKKRKRTIARSSVAVMAVCVFLTGVYTIGFRLQQRQNPAGVKQAQRIELQLPDGKVVDLSTEKPQVQVDNITLKNTQQTLTYFSDKGSPAGWAALRVPAGKDYKVQLSDGTFIWLNSGSQLQFPFTFNGNTREININGEAYLKVTKNTRQPFIVHLPTGSVQVLGTTFNVNSYDSGQVKVALIEGSVKIRTNDHVQVLKPGYQMSYTLQKGSQVSPFEEATVLSWQQGIYLFDDATLEEICLVIPRWFGIEVVIDNQGAATKHFAGYLDRNKPLKVSLDHLKATNLIDYYFDDDNVLHIK